MAIYLWQEDGKETAPKHQNISIKLPQIQDRDTEMEETWSIKSCKCDNNQPSWGLCALSYPGDFDTNCTSKISFSTQSSSSSC